MSEEQRPETAERRESGEERKPARKAGFWQVVISVLAGAFGVQSRRRQEMDFSSQSPLPFIIGGVIFTLLFIGTLVLLVSLITGE